MKETLRLTRERIDGVYFSVHVSADGRLRVCTGRDDQRPDHDGRQYFQPICVEERLVGGGLYTYHKYCGACRQRMGGLGEVKEHCPRCGKGIAHYGFSMGTDVHQARDWNDRMPDVWPVATVVAVRSALPPGAEGQQRRMTAQEFADAYAQRSGVTVEWLHEQGREARPCDCGEDGCEGWQMAHVREEAWFKAQQALARTKKKHAKKAED